MVPARALTGAARAAMRHGMLMPVLLLAFSGAAVAAPQAAPLPSSPPQAQPKPPLSTHAQPTRPPPVKAPPVPLLWKVSDADNAVYVLGSFHLLKPDDYPLAQDVERAFADAEQVVFELPPEEMASPILGLQMAQAAKRTDGSSLDSELTPEVAAKLKTWLDANGLLLQSSRIDPQALHAYEPWFVGVTVSILTMTQMGLDPRLGLDAYFAQAAAQAGKPTAGLETGAQQIAFLDGMDRAEQVQLLAEALDESEQGRTELERLHAQWRGGDEQGLREGLAAEMQIKFRRLYQRINVERNDAWIPKIEQRLASGKDDTLLIVGALHTLGRDGVVEKLRARGYKVERICSACAGRGAAAQIPAAPAAASTAVEPPVR